MMSRTIHLLGAVSVLLCSGCCCSEDADDVETPALPQPPSITETSNTTSPPVRAVPTPPPLPTPPPRPTVAELPHGDNDAPGQTFRVQFEKGTSGATLKGSVLRGERNRYLLGAKEGQVLRARITSLENNATFSILAPGGMTIPGTEEERDLRNWDGRLPASGNTTVVVGPTRGNATYTLHVEITAQ